MRDFMSRNSKIPSHCLIFSWLVKNLPQEHRTGLFKFITFFTYQLFISLLWCDFRYLFPWLLTMENRDSTETGVVVPSVVDLWTIAIKRAVMIEFECRFVKPTFYNFVVQKNYRFANLSSIKQSSFVPYCAIVMYLHTIYIVLYLVVKIWCSSCNLWNILLLYRKICTSTMD